MGGMMGRGEGMVDGVWGWGKRFEFSMGWAGV